MSNKSANNFEVVLKEASKKSISSFGLQKTYPAYIVLVLALLASVFLWKFMENKVEDDNTIAFEKATTSVTNRLQNAVNGHTQIVQSMKGLYDNYAFVVRDVFELYGSIPFSTFPSLQSIAFAQYVEKKQIGEFLYNVRSDRYYSYNVHPAGERDFYFPTYFLVPFDKNVSISGFDIATNPLILAPAQKARAEHKITASSFLTIRKPDTTGFILFVDADKKDTLSEKVGGTRRDISGVVFVEILADKFFKFALGEGTATDSSVIFTCVDTSSAGKQTVYKSKNAGLAESGYKPLYTQQVSINIADRAFVVEFATVPGFGGSFHNNLPIISLIASLITSVLLFAFTISILTSRARAQDLAERMTRSQRRIVDTSKDIISIEDSSGTWKSMNPAVLAILQYEPEELLGKQIFDFIVPEDRERTRTLLDTAPDEKSVTYEVRMQSRTGEVRWVSWNSTVSKSDGLVYSIGRDITDQKLAEEQIKLKSKQVELARQFTVQSAVFQSHFMSKASFSFRTSLTGIIGYLQLLTAKMYSNEEEQNFFMENAYHGAEEMLNRVNDLLDVAEGDSSTQVIRVENTNLSTEEVFKDILNTEGLILPGQDIRFDTNLEIPSDYALMANKEVFVKALRTSIATCLSDVKSGEVQIFLQANTFESVAELQILLPPDEIVGTMISMLKRADESQLIELLAKDQNDVIFRLSGAISQIKTMNGTMIVDTLGKDGNVIMMTLPIKKLSVHGKRLVKMR